MYFQIEGRMNMKTITFDEENLTVGKQIYPLDEIEKIEITNAPLFATYGIMSVHLRDKNISVPFPRSGIEKLRRALHEFEHEQMVRRQQQAQKAQSAAEAARSYDNALQQMQHDTVQTVQSDAVPAQSRNTYAPQPIQYDPYEEVKKLKELLDMGIVTEEEFQKKKKELLKL